MVDANVSWKNFLLVLFAMLIIEKIAANVVIENNKLPFIVINNPYCTIHL